jgi:glycosyltransferase involved in cell wall biosynthesis
MKILATQETDWLNRNPIIHHRLLETLSRRGDEVRVIDYDIDWAKHGGPILQHRREFHDTHKYFADSRITVIRPAMVRTPIAARVSWLLGNWQELRKIFRDDRPDVVVAYGISNALLSLGFSRAARLPFVYHVMDALHTHADAPLVRAVARIVERLTMRRADRVIVVSQGLARYATGMGARPERLEVVPIAASRVRPDPELGARVRASLGVSEGEVMLLFVGWQYAFSGLRELVSDFARRGHDFPWLRLVIVGSGELYEELQRLRAQSGLERQVILTGQRPVEEVGGFIEAADFGLLPARRNETMEHLVPTKVVEYMERGKPVIATRLPGLEAEFASLPGILYIERPEETIDRVIALDAGDPVAIRATARRLGETCRDAIQRRDDWDAVTEKFASILRSLVEERERAPLASPRAPRRAPDRSRPR